MLSNHSFPFVLLICEEDKNTLQHSAIVDFVFISLVCVCAPKPKHDAQKINLRNIMEVLLIDRWLNATHNDWIYELLLHA